VGELPPECLVLVVRAFADVGAYDMELFVMLAEGVERSVGGLGAEEVGVVREAFGRVGHEDSHLMAVLDGRERVLRRERREREREVVQAQVSSG
jgi:hypothetical protein